MGAVSADFRRTFGGEQCEYVFLAKTHCGIPDVEILDKLLRPGAVLVTGDCVLHTRALEQGCRSYTLNEHGQLTRQRLPHVRPTKPLPKSVHSTLQADYRQQAAHDLARRLKTDFTDRQFKRYRTARRRIRSHFGSAAAISQVLATLTLHPCVKGPFHDAMQAKLKQLTRTRSNEVTSLDFDRIATCFLAAELTESPSLPT